MRLSFYMWVFRTGWMPERIRMWAFRRGGVELLRNTNDPFGR